MMQNEALVEPLGPEHGLGRRRSWRGKMIRQQRLGHGLKVSITVGWQAAHRLGHEGSSHQLLRVGMVGVIEHLVGQPGFDHLTVLHHHQPMG